MILGTVMSVPAGVGLDPGNKGFNVNVGANEMSCDVRHIVKLA
jgi:hypothetical protein